MRKILFCIALASSLLATPVFANWDLHAGIDSIAAGATHTCAVLADQHVSCWGSGGAVNSVTPTPIPGINSAIAVKSGNNFSCALLSDRTVSCWGDNSFGELGDGTYNPRYLAPAPVMLGIHPFSDVQSIAIGSSHVCAVRTDTSVWCWGSNTSGQLGNHNVPHTNFRQPIQVVIRDDVHGDQPLTGVGSVAAGITHTCALFSGNYQLACWGGNTFQQVGDDEATVDVVESPVAVGVHDSHGNPINYSAAFEVVAGGFGNCVIPIDWLEPTIGIRCWGDNSSGQAGIMVGIKTPTPTPLTWITFKPLTITWNLAMGERFGCVQAQDQDGSDHISVFCWGSNNAGQLGNATIPNSPWPLVIKKASGQAFDYEEVRQVSAGWEHVCILTKDHGPDEPQRVWCWGSNASGQLGNGSSNLDRNPVPSIANVDAPIFCDKFGGD